VVLWLAVMLVGMEIGGGLYEWRCVYPMWSGAAPDALRQRLAQSGQALAGRRFWPLLSPALALLSILNLVAAYQSASPERVAWLVGAAIVLLGRAVTFAYFVPTLSRITDLRRAMPAQRLARTVRRWVGLSPLRIAAAACAWLLLVWVSAHAVR
jgi:hypothetical protein